MISPAYFKKVQEAFFRQVTSCCNQAEVNFKYVTVSHSNSYEKFTGDGYRGVDKEFKLKCLYMRDISDKQREKHGIAQEVTDVLYVSPLELRKKTESINFPVNMRNSYANVEVSFLGKSYNIHNIKDLEPMHNGTEEMCVAYQINLKLI